jgi:hypothetical protein
MSTEALPDVGRDLLRIHKVITRAIEVSLQNSQDGNLAEANRQGFVVYLQAMITFIESHHMGEDEIAFPFARVRMPDGPFDMLGEHHRQVSAYQKQIELWLKNDPATWQPATLSELHHVLVDLQTLWLYHISIEEATIGPEYSQKLLTPVENEQLGRQLSEHGQAHSQPSQLVMPFVLYNLSIADREEISRQIPAVVTQQLIPFAWKAVWEPMTPFLLIE